MAADRRGHFGRTRFGSVVNVVLAAVITVIALYVGVTRNPLAYGIAVVGAFMTLLFCSIAARVWRGEDPDRR